MQCTSNIRSYVFRSIFIPYLSPCPPSTSTSTSTSTIRQNPTRCNNRARCQFRQSSSTTRRYNKDGKHAQNAESRRPISSLQQVKGHDPPSRSHNMERQTISQQRTREYLGFENKDMTSKNDRSSADYAETSIRALQKALQAYTPYRHEDKDREDKKGKARDSGLQADGKPDQNTSYPPDHVLAPTPELSQIPIFQSRETPQTNVTHPPSISTSLEHANPASTHKESSNQRMIDLKSTIQYTSFPPTIQKLLSARLFRLTVFHVISTPEFATDQILVFGIANHLEEKGAGKLAKRLRRGWENSYNDSDNRKGINNELEQGNSVKGNLRLYSQPKDKSVKDNFKLPVGYWSTSPNIPPSQPIFNPNISKQDNLTEFYNSHIDFLLRQSTLTNCASSQYPTSSFQPKSQWPGPSTNLNQLYKLIKYIEILERTRGFKPNSKTANLIIGCYLRSTTSSSSSSSYDRSNNVKFDSFRNVKDREYRGYNDSSGQVRIVKKQISEKGLNKLQLRKLFEVFSKLITSTRNTHSSIVPTQKMNTTSKSDNSINSLHPSTSSLLIPQTTLSEPESQSHASSSIDMTRDVEIQDQKQKEWDEIIRPFGKQMIRSMKILHDTKGIDLVKDWMKEEKINLLGEHNEIE
ncbi:uncharacterized protein L201_005269 [Kwoniella dendrophila CBS 6074]|uniref:Uncharacterized protein n=1 Tax=Kwoniella dendrophila CBS 6074 TaxID=1295534 RepID=A0AAX4JYN8_9TREE